MWLWYTLIRVFEPDRTLQPICFALNTEVEHFVWIRAGDWPWRRHGRLSTG